MVEQQVPELGQSGMLGAGPPVAAEAPLVIDEVNRFKGDTELADDLTVVVAKVGG